MLFIYTHIAMAKHRIRTPAGCVTVVGDCERVRLMKSPRGLIGKEGQRYQWSHLAQVWYWNESVRHQWVLEKLQRVTDWTHSAEVKRGPGGLGPTVRRVYVKTIDRLHLRDSYDGIWSLKPCSAVPRKRPMEGGFEEYLFRLVELPVAGLNLVQEFDDLTYGDPDRPEAKSYIRTARRKGEDDG
jgi:hypothetical protein